MRELSSSSFSSVKGITAQSSPTAVYAAARVVDQKSASSTYATPVDCRLIRTQLGRSEIRVRLVPTPPRISEQKTSS